MKKLIALFLSLIIGIAPLSFVSAEEAETSPITYLPSDIHLDLSVMSGTVVYSMIYNIMVEPDSFLGQVLKIKGYYSAWEDPNTGLVYHSCVIPDATACCAQGIEFVWAGEHSYPEDYPEMGTDMIVTGRLESYIEGDYLYLHLVDSEVNWL